MLRTLSIQHVARDAEVATVEVHDGVVAVTAVDIGFTRITLTATDGIRSAQQDILTIVLPRRPKVLRSVADVALAEGEAASEIRLADYRDGKLVRYQATAVPGRVVHVWESGGRLKLTALAAAPVLTTSVAADLIGRSLRATTQVMDQLVRAGLLIQITVGRRNRAFEAPELIEAFTAFERGLASPEGDRAIADPALPVPPAAELSPVAPPAPRAPTADFSPREQERYAAVVVRKRVRQAVSDALVLRPVARGADDQSSRGSHSHAGMSRAAHRTLMSESGSIRWSFEDARFSAWCPPSTSRALERLPEPLSLGESALLLP